MKDIDFVNLCDDRDSEIRQALVGYISDNDEMSLLFSGMLSGLSVYALIEIEKNIISMEHYLSSNPENRVTNKKRLEKYRQEYVAYHKQLTETCENFNKIYDEVKNVENDCARNNLINSNGTLYSYVLPKFFPDGTHEPWGEKDVPWNVKN